LYRVQEKYENIIANLALYARSGGGTQVATIIGLTGLGSLTDLENFGILITSS